MANLETIKFGNYGVHPHKNNKPYLEIINGNHEAIAFVTIKDNEFVLADTQSGDYETWAIDEYYVVLLSDVYNLFEAIESKKVIFRSLIITALVTKSEILYSDEGKKSFIDTSDESTLHKFIDCSISWIAENLDTLKRDS